MQFWVKMAASAALAVGVLMRPAAAVDVAPFVKKDRFGEIKISPAGDYYAATVPVEGKTVLVVLRRSDNKMTATFALGKNTHVAGFWWVNPQRVLISIAEKFGELDEPALTGEIYAINADGSQADLLVGQRVQGNGPGTKIQPKKVERVAAFLIDGLSADDDNVLIAVSPFSTEPYTRVEKMDIYSGRRAVVARAPIRNARFVTDNRGVVRFARGSESDNASKLFYRDGEGNEWKLINDETLTARVESPIGFSADDSTAYIEVEQASGPNGIVAMDVKTGVRKDVLRDDDTDPYGFIYRNDSRIPIGARFMDGKPRNVYFDDASPEAKLQRSLDAAFGGDFVTVTSQTADGRLALVHTWSDRNPGDYFLFDTVAKKAEYVLSQREWFDPAKMAQMRPVSLTARDGLALKGYLTLPHGSAAKGLPLIVMPHGGPFGVYDKWGFASESQLLAAAGYAVLQVNYRGSGNHGRAFKQAGAREWGGKMQDDLTDATRWAIRQGIADEGRICLYGASYGGYASLMGVAKEPALYRCAAGYVGVYDLPMMHSEDTRRAKWTANWAREWVGDHAQLGAVSPNRMATRIRVPIFLAAGGEDEIAPIEHTKMMEKALRAAGVPVETLYYDTEGHGFYVEAHRQEYYSKLLSFLGRHIGVGAPSSSSAAK